MQRDDIQKQVKIVLKIVLKSLLGFSLMKIQTDS